MHVLYDDVYSLKADIEVHVLSQSPLPLDIRSPSSHVAFINGYETKTKAMKKPRKYFKPFVIDNKNERATIYFLIVSKLVGFVVESVVSIFRNTVGSVHTPL